MIDVNVLFGASPRAWSPAAYSIEAACRELTRHQVHAALVCSRSGATYTHEVGNRDTFEAVDATASLSLWPVATVNPVQTHQWRREAARACAAGAVAVRLFPDVQGWDVASSDLRGLTRPLLVPVTRYGEAHAIGAATERVGQPVVLLGAHYTQLADCLAALDRWPHLFLETSRLGQFRGVQTVVEAVGAQRLLFGSATPERPMMAPLNAILGARISDQDKRSMLAGNAARLFGLPEPHFELPAPVRGRELIDVHCHTGQLPFPTPRMDRAEWIARQGEHGIVRSFASSLRAIMTGDHATDNDGEYVVCNPNDPDGARAVLDRAVARGVAGAKIHCQWSGQPTAGRPTIDLMSEIARRDLPLKIHVDGPDWDRALLDVAARFPRWPLIIAHGGPGAPARAAAAVVERTDNVFVELATTAPDLPVVRDVVRRVGTDRLLFGTDAPLIEPDYVLGLYADADADLARTADVARAVFHLNPAPGGGSD